MKKLVELLESSSLPEAADILARFRSWTFGSETDRVRRALELLAHAVLTPEVVPFAVGDTVRRRDGRGLGAFVIESIVHGYAYDGVFPIGTPVYDLEKVT